MFESRRVEKHYLAVVQGLPAQNEWTCNLWIYPDTKHKGIMKTMPPDPRAATARDALTHFRVLQSKGDKTLIEACPETGRTHQIRVHLAAAGLAVIGDDKYGTPSSPPAKPPPLALRAWQLHYRDPFRKQMVHIRAPAAEFIRAHGFDALETRIAPPKIDSPPTPH
jgi:23S rRNA pseudouridine1911/1915/1917 synthase